MKMDLSTSMTIVMMWLELHQTTEKGALTPMATDGQIRNQVGCHRMEPTLSSRNQHNGWTAIMTTLGTTSMGTKAITAPSAEVIPQWTDSAALTLMAMGILMTTPVASTG